MTDENFTHGKLYVALSRVGSPNCLSLLVREDCKTRNVVHSKVYCLGSSSTYLMQLLLLVLWVSSCGSGKKCHGKQCIKHGVLF